jgi:hypothetical protein
MSLAFAAILLGVVAGVYFGFASLVATTSNSKLSSMFPLRHRGAARIGHKPLVHPDGIFGAWSLGFRPS